MPFLQIPNWSGRNLLAILLQEPDSQRLFLTCTASKGHWRCLF